MKFVVDPVFELEGWFDSALSLEGWLDDELAADGSPPPTRNGPTVKSTASNNSGTAASNSTNVTLPSGLSDGDVAYMIVSLNSATDRGDPSGWTLLDFTTASTVLQQKVYRKSLLASDSGTNVAWTLSNSQKWNIALVVVQDDGGVDVQGTAWSSSSASTSWQIDAVTPTVDDDLLLAAHSWRVNVTGTTTQSPPSGWTEDVETSLNASAAPTLAAAGNSRELTGGAGVSTGSVTNGGYDQSATHHISLHLAIKPVAGGPQTFFQTLNASASPAAVRSLLAQLSRSASATPAASRASVAQLTRSSSATPAASDVLQVRLSRSVAGTSSVSLSQLKAVLRTLTASAAGVASRVLGVQLSRSSSATGSASRQSQVQLSRSVAGTSSVSLAQLKVALRALTATAAGAVTRSLQVQLTRSTSAAGAATRSLQVRLTRAAGAAGAATRSLQVRLKRAVSRAWTSGTNLSPDFSEWTLNGGASIVGGELVLPANAYAESPLMLQGYASAWSFTAECFTDTQSPYVPYQPNGGRLFTSANYAADGTTAALNTAGFTTNGNAAAVTLNAWTSTSWGFATGGGPEVAYVRLRVWNDPSWSAGTLKYRNPHFQAALSPTYAPFGSVGVTLATLKAILRALSASSSGAVSFVKSVSISRAAAATGAATRTLSVRLSRAVAATGSATRSLRVNVTRAASAAGSATAQRTVQLTRAAAAAGVGLLTKVPQLVGTVSRGLAAIAGRAASTAATAARAAAAASPAGRARRAGIAQRQSSHVELTERDGPEASL